MGGDFGLAEIHKLYRCHDRLLAHKEASGGAFVRARRIGGIVSGLAKCPTCKERLGSVELQRLRVTGIMPRGVQLYVAACPHCATPVPFAAMPVTATMARMIARAAAERASPRGRRRARNVHESVRRLLAATKRS